MNGSQTQDMELSEAVSYLSSIASVSTSPMDSTSSRMDKLKQEWMELVENNKYRPADSVIRTDRIFVKGLPFDVKFEEVREAFIEFGDVKFFNVITDKDGRSRGFGFVHFEDAASIPRILQSSDRFTIRDQKVLVNVAVEKRKRSDGSCQIIQKMLKNVLKIGEPAKRSADDTSLDDSVCSENTENCSSLENSQHAPPQHHQPQQLLLQQITYPNVHQQILPEQPLAAISNFGPYHGSGPRFNNQSYTNYQQIGAHIQVGKYESFSQVESPVPRQIHFPAITEHIDENTWMRLKDGTYWYVLPRQE